MTSLAAGWTEEAHTLTVQQCQKDMKLEQWISHVETVSADAL